VHVKLIYCSLGWCAATLAIVGIVVPGLPTTVFVLVASYCFSRSSPRFERWLRGHPRLGPVLRRFARNGGMPASAKRAALTAMWTAVGGSSVMLMSVHPTAALVTVGLGAVGTLSILFGVQTVPEHVHR
jgi:uncharacterized membrane protein YbaN (DUF454 family)